MQILQFLSQHMLSLILWLPFFTGIAILPIRNIVIVNSISLIGATICFMLTILLFMQFDISSPTMQFIEHYSWINSLNINYSLGVDGISLLLLMLNNFITLVVIIANIRFYNQLSLYNALFLIMATFVSGAFLAIDAILFYVFFEAMLIPMYFIIGIWGGANRIYAAIKFFLYTLLGSLFMLLIIIYLNHMTNSFNIFEYYKIDIPITIQGILFIGFFVAFAVKVPMWPLHTWLPDAHPEAPTAGSMVLAAITLKIGAYGFLRFVLPIVPDASRLFAPYMTILALIAVVYIGLVALVQTDLKKLVAYSSISHMGFVILGIFMFDQRLLNQWAVSGAIVQMISHGFISAALFMCVGVMYDRVHSRDISAYGGVAKHMPKFAALFMLFAMSNSGLPGTSGFVGEFMVILGTLQVNIPYAFIATITVVLGAGYTLWMYKRTMFGEVKFEYIANLSDINLCESIVLALLACAVIIVGVYPKLLTDVLDVSVNNTISLASRYKS